MATKTTTTTETTSSSANGLTKSYTRILTALAKGPMDRNELRKATGIEKGYSKLLGAHTHENNSDGMIGEGLVKVLVPEEGHRGHRYAITAKGTKALEKAAKAEAKAKK